MRDRLHTSVSCATRTQGVDGTRGLDSLVRHDIGATARTLISQTPKFLRCEGAHSLLSLLLASQHNVVGLYILPFVFES